MLLTEGHRDARLPVLIEAAEAGLTLAQIGQRLGVTRQRAHQLMNREGLQAARQTVKAARREERLIDEAWARLGEEKKHALQALQTAGVKLEFEYRPLGRRNCGVQYRIVVHVKGRDGGEAMVRTSHSATPTTPNGPAYYRSGEVLPEDRHRPLILITPVAVHLWLGGDLPTMLYVRAEPLLHPDWSRVQRPPSLSVPLL